MGKFVRQREEEVTARLKRRAKRDGRSQATANLGSRIAARFKKAGLTADLPELRGLMPTTRDF